MADILKLKKKAAEFEAKKQMDKALDAYREIVQAFEDGSADAIDIPLYNRVGDMLQKAGSLSEAVAMWERAVDLYTEGGFFNPAIALCNKILRASPGRTVIYYKLGKIHAEKGFKGDARQNFLEYASRQQKAGNLDDAFKALKEFAELVPDQYDVRLMLADQLLKTSRRDEAIAQLQLGYAQALAVGDAPAAEQIAAKMKEIDPAVEPRVAGPADATAGGGLVFLDLDDGSAPPAPRKSARPTPLSTKRASKAMEGLAILPVDDPVEGPSAVPARETREAPRPLEPLEPAVAAADSLVLEPTDVGGDVAPPPRGSLLGLEITDLAANVPAAAGLPMLDLESTGVEGSTAEDIALEDIGLEELAVEGIALEGNGLEDIAVDAIAVEGMAAAAVPLLEIETTAVDLPLLEPEPTAGAEPSLLDIDLSGPEAAPLVLEEPTFGSDLPLLAVEPSVEEAPPLFSDDMLESPPMESVVAPAVVPASSTVSPAALYELVVVAPEDYGLRRQYAEAVLEQGDRDTAVRELEVAMGGFERQGDLDTAGSIAEEIVRVLPKSIRHHQKRVEYAFRADDRPRLAEAYVELADALLADGQAEKARAVYQRVLDIKPDDLRAQAAIESIAPAAETPPAPSGPTDSEPVSAAPAPTAAPVVTAPASTKASDEEYVSLGDWLREDDEPKNTRMVVEAQEPTGDEAADFADMLRKFKQGVSDNVEEEDHEAHYDLGVAYKEMGLLDEAISEFQKALRGTEQRTRTFEALGHCFIEKGQLPVAATILQRALAEPDVRDEALVGVLYLLGTIAEEQQRFADAKKHYERVFAVDIQFRDVGERLNSVEQRLS